MKAFIVNSKYLFNEKKNPKLSLSVKDILKIKTKKQLAENFLKTIELAELRALSKISLTRVLTHTEFKRMLQLSKKYYQGGE